MKTELSKRRIAVALHALLVSGGMAFGQAPAPVTDAEKQHITGLVRSIVQQSTLPAWQGVVLPSFDLNLSNWNATDPGSWKRGILTFINAPLGVEYYGRRDAVMSFSVNPDWLRLPYDPNALMSVDAAQSRLQSVLESIVPTGWSVDLHAGPFPSTRPDVVATFEWNPRYHGYLFEAAQGCEFQVDRLTGCIVDFRLRCAGFPVILDEDCPQVSNDAKAALGATAQAMYAGYQPLLQAQTAGPAMALISPAFDGFPNQMTDRHRQRAANRQLILACRFQAYGYDDGGNLWLQDFYVDAVTGQPIGLHAEPRSEVTGAYGPQPHTSLNIEPAKGLWRVATQANAQSFSLTAKKATAPDKSDGRCVLISSEKKAVRMDVNLKARLLWYGTGKEATVWGAPKGAWRDIAAALKNVKPFPPKAAKQRGSSGRS